jgi:hypothetical protein
VQNDKSTYISDAVPYQNYYLKSQLQNRYGNAIYFAESAGLHDLLSMREKTSVNLRSYYNNMKQEDDEESPKRAILETSQNHQE